MAQIRWTFQVASRTAFYLHTAAMILMCVIVPVFAAPEADWWALVNPILTGSSLRDVAFNTPNEGWAVGANGVIAHTIDSGNTWRLQTTPLQHPPALISIAHVKQDTLFTVGGVFGRTYALKTMNGGNEWLDVTDDFPEGGLRKVYVRNGKIWVARWSRTPNLSLSTDGGKTWVDDTIGDVLVNDLLFVNDQVGICCGDKGYIGKTTDGGVSWIKAEGNYTGIFIQLSATRNTLYALSMTSELLYSIDSGTIWSSRGRFSNMQATAMCIRTNATTGLDGGFIVGSANPCRVLKFQNFSDSTKPVFFSTAIQSGISAIAPVTDTRAIGICLDGSIHQLFGLADSGMEVTSNTGNRSIVCIDFNDSLHGVGIDDKCTVFRTADAGVTWNKYQGPDSSRPASVVAFADGRILLSTFSRTVYLSSDYGKNWTTTQTTEFTLNMKKYGAISNDAYYWDGNRIEHSNDAGRTWVRRGDVVFNFSKERDACASIYFQSRSCGWACSIYGAVSRTIDSGYTWKPVNGISDSIAVADVFFIDSVHGWISGAWTRSGGWYKPLIYYTDDAGSHWTAQTNINFVNMQTFPVDVPFQAQILKIRGNSISSLWALSDHGVLFSADSGKKWQQQTVPQYGNIFTGLYLLNNGDMFVAGDNERIWKHTGVVDSAVKRPHTPRTRLYGPELRYVSIFNLRGERLKAPASLRNKSFYNAPQGVYIVTGTNKSAKSTLKMVILK